LNSILISYSSNHIVVISKDGQLYQTFSAPDDAFLKSIEELSATAEIIVDSSIIANALSQQNIQYRLDLDHPILKSWRVDRYTKLHESGLVGEYSVYIDLVRAKAVLDTREGIKENAGKRDELAAQIVHTIDDLQKSYNLLTNRLRELYSLYFPELVNTISNPSSLAKIIIDRDNRETIDSQYLAIIGLPAEQISQIVDATSDSLGGELAPGDIKPIQTYAQSLLELDQQLSHLEKWIDKEMENIAPNLTAVAGANVGARLISAMGSLRQLAMKSSSKIQTIGAEKALYASLRGKGAPPKHGIIFQIPEIGNSPFWLRGKLARAYAGKIAIAARLDEFGGEFLGAEMRKELRSLEGKLREQFPSAPIKKRPVRSQTKQHPAVKRKKRRKQ
jgi:nucleolar protein 56